MTLMQQMRLAFLWIVQLILFRIAIGWDSGIKKLITEQIKWHGLALSLTIPLVLGLYNTWCSKTQTIDTSSGAGYIIAICKAMLFLIMALTSSLVFMYKSRAEPHGSIPEFYGSWMNRMEFAAQLDQVALGKLIYNYCGSGMFMLAALVYAINRARVLDLEGIRNAIDTHRDIDMLTRSRAKATEALFGCTVMHHHAGLDPIHTT